MVDGYRYYNWATVTNLRLAKINSLLYYWINRKSSLLF